MVPRVEHFLYPTVRCSAELGGTASTSRFHKFWSVGCVCYSQAMIRKALLLAWVPGIASVVLSFVAVYCSWAVAYAQLGRHPQPLVDDPKFIGGLSTVVYSFCMWAIAALAAVWTVSALLTIVTGVLSKAEQRGAGWLGFASVFGFSLLFFGLYLPNNAISWFFD